MPSYKTTILGLIALLSGSVLAWDDCVAVLYKTSLKPKTDQQLPIIGPKGIYFNYDNSTCIFVDTSANGTFANDHADEHSAFITAIKENGPIVPGLEFLDGETLGRVKRLVPCGSIWGNNLSQKKCEVGCNCKFSSRYCDQNLCYNT